MFDGYTSDLAAAGTKSAERISRLKKHRCAYFSFNKTTTPSMAQEKFLSNESNKEQFVQMLKAFFERCGIEVGQDVEDADVLIANTSD